MSGYSQQGAPSPQHGMSEQHLPAAITGTAKLNSKMNSAKNFIQFFMGNTPSYY